MDLRMFPYRGSTALITGASIGIGAEFAKVLASRGMNLVLVARNKEKMDALASELSTKYNVQTHVIACDLGQASAVAELTSAVVEKGLTIDLLINNAGFMTYGPFETIDPAKEHGEVMVNIAAVVGLTHAFLPGMLERRKGAVMNIASTAAFQPIPYMAVYAASKAFVKSFSVALWEECRERNVHVMAMCPGTTKTELFERAAAKEAAPGGVRTVQQVVETALNSLDKKKSLVVDGFVNSVLAWSTRLVPNWMAAKYAAKAAKPD